MVVKKLIRQLALSVSQNQPINSCDDRCVADRMGNCFRQSEVVRNIEQTLQIETHQQNRAVDSAQSVANRLPTRQR